jgi:phage baseplate assembly protein W
VAYSPVNINPLDLRPSVGIGVSIPFSSAQVFSSVFTTKEQVRYNLINYVLTDPGERIFEPNFGLGLRSKLFTQLTVDFEEELKSLVTRGIETNFPMIEIDKVLVESRPEENGVYLYVSYRIQNTGMSDEILLLVRNEQ